MYNNAEIKLYTKTAFLTLIPEKVINLLIFGVWSFVTNNRNVCLLETKHLYIEVLPKHLKYVQIEHLQALISP